MASLHDLLIVGGGINGVGIARDAAGRGLSVMLVERDDLAAHTSSWSTKLIHGGLRYLEHYEFRLVAEALREREVLLQARAAPDRAADVRAAARAAPAAGVDDPRRACSSTTASAAAMTLPRSHGVRLDRTAVRRGAEAALPQRASSTPTRASTMRASSSPTRCDARDRAPTCARACGWSARCATRARGARRSPGPTAPFEVRARALVNAAGPWVKDVLGRVEGGATRATRPPRQGQPHRRAARARRAARVHPAERRPAHRVRHPVRRTATR